MLRVGYNSHKCRIQMRKECCTFQRNDLHWCDQPNLLDQLLGQMFTCIGSLSTLGLKEISEILTPFLVQLDHCLDTICIKSYLAELHVSRHISLTCSKEILRPSFLEDCFSCMGCNRASRRKSETTNNSEKIWPHSLYSRLQQCQHQSERILQRCTVVLLCDAGDYFPLGRWRHSENTLRSRQSLQGICIIAISLLNWIG